jgi:DNA-binding IscR family transcriptional regulator
LTEENAAEQVQDDRDRCECLVKKVMDGAEQQLYQYLREHTIQTVLDAASMRGNCDVNKK